MKSVLLLLKYDGIFHWKAIWRAKWQFLFLFLFLLGIFQFVQGNSPKQFSVTLFNEDQSYASKLAIKNYTKSLNSTASIEEVMTYPDSPESDVFVYFPKGFAEKWQYFEPTNVEFHILTKNPIYQAVFKETFHAYEDILLGSESVITAYNELLAQIGDERFFEAENMEISLDFIALTFQRAKLWSPKLISGIPASFHMQYFFFSISLFLGILLAIAGSAGEGNKQKVFQRIFLTRIHPLHYFLAGVLKRFFLFALYLIPVYYISIYLQLSLPKEYFIFSYLIFLNLSFVCWASSYYLESTSNYSMVWMIILLLTTLLGGAFFPVSLLPSSWLWVVHLSPFYHLFLFLITGVIEGFSAHHFSMLLIVFFVLILYCIRLLWRKQYA